MPLTAAGRLADHDDGVDGDNDADDGEDDDDNDGDDISDGDYGHDDDAHPHLHHLSAVNLCH